MNTQEIKEKLCYNRENGYKKVSDIFYEVNVPHVKMVKEYNK